MPPAGPGPRTVLPQRDAGPARPSADLYDRFAEPVLAYAEKLSQVKGEELGSLLQQARTLLDRFAADIQRAGAIASTVPPARLALGLILDQKARANRGIDVKAWSAGAHRFVFDGRDVSLATLHDFARRAAQAGHDFDGIRTFLERCIARLEGERRRVDRAAGSSWTGIVVVLVLAFCGAVAGWAGWIEWRFHRDLTRVFSAEALEIGLDRTGDIPDLPARLDRLAAAVDRVSRQAEGAPVTLAAALLGFDARKAAARTYAEAVARHVPPVAARAVDDVFASEGDPETLYDALRVWAILSGQSQWSRGYLSGWLADRARIRPELHGLARHVGMLDPPAGPLPQPDAELMGQARDFAAEADEAGLAYLELRRSDAVAALAPWRLAEAVPDLDGVLERRSGLSIAEPIPGLFTTAGWAHARDVGAGVAVQTARAEAARLLATTPAEHNDAPDRVMQRLQDETIAAWSDYLDDLRVRPFADPDVSVMVSGRLSLATSPLDTLLRDVWENAGGNDRRRSHAQQLAVAAEFAAMIQYVEQGRIADISALFAGLNVALGAMDRDEEAGMHRLMSVQDRAASIVALRQAPRVVVQIVEDVLAQTGASHADVLTNPLTRAWQTEALSQCQQTVEGRFPFADGADADPDALARFLGPGGTADRFFRTRAEPYLDTTASPWRWKPEARFEGLAPESAAFFQKTQALAAGLFGSGAGTDLTLSALAERGKAYVAIGGQGGPVETATDALRLSWPGPDPAAGVEVRFATPDGEARMAEAGPWGFLRLLAPLRLRERDEGKRFLVDLRSGSGRLFVEIGFPTPANPLAFRGLLKGLACPQVL